MKRIATVFSALVGATLAFSPLGLAEAPNKKPSPKSKDSTAKKPAVQDKKAPAGETTPADPATTKKAGASTPLDLPLPTKPEPGNSAEPDPAAKKAPEGPPRPAKPDAAPTAGQSEHPPNATVEPDEIVEFAAQPPRIQQLLRDAIDLTRLNLIYTFGSADPDNGGMDCSGTIQYLLHAHRLHEVPRDSSEQYLWARKHGVFFPVVSKKPDGVEFDDLLPGDLLFWTGTYDTQRDVPISHVMLYLGREKSTGKRIVFGASDGRSYAGIKRWGVSIFDFTMPKSDPDHPEKTTADFVGYARIPGLRQGAAAGSRVVADASAGSIDKTKPATGETATKRKSAEAKTSSSDTKPKSSSRKKKR